MSLTDRDKLREIKTFPSLVKYLRDELEWPIEQESFDDLTYDYEPEELGLDAKTAAKIDSIKQLRPLDSNQPWGIFFLKFEPKSLPVVALRRILSQLVFKKRTSANKADRQAWLPHDLLFISNYGEGETRQITFAHFSDPPKTSSSDLPTLKVLGWDEADTVLHIEHAHQTFKEKLHWPKDPAFVDSWRKNWSAAFTERKGEVITTTKDLCIRMAHLASAIRKKVNAILAVESDKGPLKQLMKGFQQALIHDLKPDDFADMYAQTITYGMLSARVARHSPDESHAGLVAENIVDMVPITNPFLRELLSTFLTIGGRKGKLDFDELGINDVVEALRQANMGAVLRDFNDKNPAEDPVIHFYELFLKEYDAKKRMQRGVFYTPKPVVSYIVRSVHELLQTEFGLADGLADTTTWADMIDRSNTGVPPASPNALKLPTITVRKPNSPDSLEKPIDPNTPFVNILDPATGTATFLVEAIEIIAATMKAKWGKELKLALPPNRDDLIAWKNPEIQERWNDYVPDHLLPRLHGFELMMAPYAIAHMKIGLKLGETGYKFKSHERARVYLTNSLEPAQDFSDKLAFEAPALAHEAQAVNAVKRHQRFTVVIGNPPYAGNSTNQGDWIVDLLKQPLPQDPNAGHFYAVDGTTLSARGEQNTRFLLDDYCKFFRLVQNYLMTSGTGLLGFITNHGYIDNPTFAGLRHSLSASLPTVNILDLHGSIIKRESAPDGTTDENVFDIQPGVAVCLMRRSRRGAVSRTVAHADLWGAREVKFDRLLQNSLSTMKWTPVSCSAPNYTFDSAAGAAPAEYLAGIDIREAMPHYANCVITKRDEFVVDIESRELANRVRDFFSSSVSDRAIEERYGVKSNYEWDMGPARRGTQFRQERLIRYLYRPFDLRFLYHDERLVARPTRKIVDHVASDNPMLILGRAGAAVGSDWSVVYIGNSAVDWNIFRRGGGTTFPLWLKSVSSLPGLVAQEDVRKANFAPVTTPAFRHLGRYDHDSLFSWIYGLFHSIQFRTRYAAQLSSNFPRILRPRTRELFDAVYQIGACLIELHLFRSPLLDKPISKYTGPANPEIEKVHYVRGTVWLDKNKTRGFSGVTEDVWNFHIGGYQVCEKWLKDRKGRTLSKVEIEHYHKIIVALHETISRMKEIDDVIEKHGGFPNAFLLSPHD